MGALCGQHEVIGIDRSPFSTTHVVGDFANEMLLRPVLRRADAVNRNRIERCFNRMKHFRRFATRYDRRTTHFQGFVYLVASMIWQR